PWDGIRPHAAGWACTPQSGEANLARPRDLFRIARPRERIGMTQTVICLKWADRYGPEYVNRRHSMVSPHTQRPLRFVCFTDDPSGLDSAVEIKPMPEFNLPE